MSKFLTQIPKTKTLFVLWKKGELYHGQPPTKIGDFGSNRYP